MLGGNCWNFPHLNLYLAWVEGKRKTRQKEDKNFAEGWAQLLQVMKVLWIWIVTNDQKFEVFDIISQLLSGLEPGFIGLILLQQSAQFRDICRVI